MEKTRTTKQQNSKYKPNITHFRTLKKHRENNNIAQTKN